MNRRTLFGMVVGAPLARLWGRSRSWTTPGIKTASGLAQMRLTDERAWAEWTSRAAPPFLEYRPWLFLDEEGGFMDITEYLD